MKYINQLEHRDIPYEHNLTYCAISNKTFKNL